MPSVHSNFLPRPSSSIFSNKPLSFTCSSDPPLFQPSEHISSEACYRLYTLYFINAFLADRECEVRLLFAAVWVNWSLLARSKDNSSQRACISTLYWPVCISIFFPKHTCFGAHVLRDGHVLCIMCASRHGHTREDNQSMGGRLWYTLCAWSRVWDCRSKNTTSAAESWSRLERAENVTLSVDLLP